MSSPSVPSENQHAQCIRQVLPFPFVTSVPENILDGTNTSWKSARDDQTEGAKYVQYATEADIVFMVRTFLTDILFAMKLRLDFNAEISIKQIRPDLCVLLNGMYLVGVVEVKKPGRNVLLEPTVLGELLDQMLLVEGFYGMGPVIGILTTAEEWTVSWFPVDTDTLGCGIDERHEASFLTPLKPTVATRDYSPPGGTPSQKSGKIHTLEDIEDIPVDNGDDDNSELSQQMERLLCTTDVLNIHSDPNRVIQLLCNAFQLMASSHAHHRANLSRCLLKFHKGSSAVTFHPMSHEVLYPMVDFDKFPSKNVKTLVALEDLGRGSTGKAWLCVTVTKPRSAVCVLKFDNKHENSEILTKEKEMWNFLYPELSGMIKLERWSGADALVMPHFTTVLENERRGYADKIFEVLTAKFQDKRKVHNDVRWRNIGKYRSKCGEVVLVIYDLHGVVDYDDSAHNDWIEKSMQSLYAGVL